MLMPPPSPFEACITRCSRGNYSKIKCVKAAERQKNELAVNSWVFAIIIAVYMKARSSESEAKKEFPLARALALLELIDKKQLWENKLRQMFVKIELNID